MKIAIGADHRGFDLKETIKKALTRLEIDVEDLGTYDKTSVDYPDFAREVALRVSQGSVKSGILICGTGLGMSIAANKVPRVRAALCLNAEMARKARLHNNANVLALAADFTSPADIDAILDGWLNTEFDGGVRHKRRIRKICLSESWMVDPLEIYEKDPDIYAALQGEARRQRERIDLVASRNFVSRAVREAQGSVLNNSAEGSYSGRMQLDGCEHMDEVEQLAIDRAKQLFDAEHVNVQPHSGSSANLAAFFTVLEPGDTMLAMKLTSEDHLTHGYNLTFLGKFFNVVPYGVDEKTEQIDYDEVDKLAEQKKPKLIVAGSRAYSRIIDFQRLRNIADSVGALLMADMADMAGLVAAGCHPNPVPLCEFVTTTTHSTLCGPRGGMILCQKRFADDIDCRVLPGIQGSPLMHVIAAKAVCFYEAMRPAFRKYQQQTVQNAQALAAALSGKKLRIVSGGTDGHLMLVDLSSINTTGKKAAAALSEAAISVSKTSIPFDSNSPYVTSGIRLGTSTVTARGMTENEMGIIAGLIADVLKHVDDEAALQKVRNEVEKLLSRFPIP